MPISLRMHKGVTKINLVIFCTH